MTNKGVELQSVAPWSDYDYTNSGIHEWQIDGLVQDCSNSSALAMEWLQSCTKPSRWRLQSELEGRLWGGGLVTIGLVSEGWRR